MCSIELRRTFDPGLAVAAAALLLSVPCATSAQVEAVSPEDREAAENAPLFSSQDPIVMRLSTDLKRLIDDRDDDREEQPATIRYLDASGQEVTIELQVEPRGNFRKEKRNCSFPPVRLNVRTGDMNGTVFEGEDKLKLVTPCREGRSVYQEYIFKEYLAYRMFNELTPVSFQVRPLDLTYEDALGEKDPIHVWAFVIEDNERLAARHSSTMGAFEQLHPAGADGDYAQLVAIFQFMIGNTDWSPVVFHNVELLRTEDARYLTVPYDFDFSGLVEARYASPDPDLGIRSVTERLFRGFCLDYVDLEPIKALFNERRPAIEDDVVSLTVAESIHGDVLDYLEEFYRILNDPSRWRRNVDEVCRKIG